MITGGCRARRMLRSPVAAAIFLKAFILARWGYRFADRSALERWQKRRVDRYLRHSLGCIGFYHHRARSSLEDLPVIDKPVLLANFRDLNRHDVSLETATALALRAEAQRDFRPTLPGGITVGLSSGTSGLRGVFLVSARERAAWAGTILARTLDARSLRQLLNPFAPRLKVTLCLRANSNLYRSVRNVRVRFQFCDLLEPMAQWLKDIGRYQPDILVAPASVLRQLAAAQACGTLAIHPRQVISVAEVLEPEDAHTIRSAWGCAPRQIYQCTEGLLGQTCAAGNLHLNEEFMHIEPRWLDATHERFTPLVTDFTRTTQAFARYHLDDILRVDRRACPCGKVTLRLASIEGRQDDTLWLPDARDLALQPVFPDVLRQMMVTAATVADYRIAQRGDEWTVQLNTPASTHDQVRREVAEAITRLCARVGWRVPTLHFAAWQPPAAGAKRRRIECAQRP
jgi:putative adenylate-forming enzyme